MWRGAAADNQSPTSIVTNRRNVFIAANLIKNPHTPPACLQLFLFILVFSSFFHYCCLVVDAPWRARRLFPAFAGPGEAMHGFTCRQESFRKKGE
jgi:hypothetical protein